MDRLHVRVSAVGMRRRRQSNGDDPKASRISYRIRVDEHGFDHRLFSSGVEIATRDGNKPRDRSSLVLLATGEKLIQNFMA